MKVKLSSLVTKTKTAEPARVAKTVERTPEVTLNTKMKGMSGLHDCKVGQKYRLVFDAEVIADRSASEWDISAEGMKPTDRIVTFKLLKGAISPEPKNIEEAGKAMKYMAM